ncbi:MAG: polysaccharide deacetylase family protein [Acetatifactor sp.]|nr:polysaccharide deacetylase family protein [Acetatifactor sp.]
MSGDHMKTDTYKRQRVQRLGRYIALILVPGVIIWIGLCIYLTERLESLDQALADTRKQLEAMAGILAEQKVRLEELERFGGELEEEVQRLRQEQAAAADPDEEEEEEEPVEPEPEAGRKVYLTFDDGPSSNTEKILDILDQYDVKATFFVVGKEGDKAEERLKQIVERGHTLAMHSYSHKYSEIYESVDNFAEDFAKLQDYLYEVTGVKCRVYRFPGGSSNTVSDLDMHDFADYLAEQKVRFFDWNVSSGDGGSQLLPVELLTENVVGGVREKSRAVVLMHDSASKSTTVEALPDIIEQILAMEDTVILPITGATEPVQHIH